MESNAPTRIQVAISLVWKCCDCEYFHVVFYITTVSLTFFGNFVPEKPDNNLKAFPNQHNHKP